MKFINITVIQYKKAGMWQVNDEPIEATINTNDVKRYWVDESKMVNIKLGLGSITNLRVKEAKSTIDSWVVK